MKNERDRNQGMYSKVEMTDLTEEEQSAMTGTVFYLFCCLYCVTSVLLLLCDYLCSIVPVLLSV